jgi:hypothetical protein
MADLKDVEMVSIGDMMDDSLENQREGKSGSRVENKPILEVSNYGFSCSGNTSSELTLCSDISTQQPSSTSASLSKRPGRLPGYLFNSAC